MCQVPIDFLKQLGHYDELFMFSGVSMEMDTPSTSTFPENTEAEPMPAEADLQRIGELNTKQSLFVSHYACTEIVCD